MIRVLERCPRGLIDLHDNEEGGKGLRDMRQKEIHHRAIGTGEHQRRHQAVLRSDRRIGLGLLAHHLPRHLRAHPWRRETSPGLTDPSKAGFVLAHRQDWAGI